jgi:hypothetical protein
VVRAHARIPRRPGDPELRGDGRPENSFPANVAEVMRKSVDEAAQGQ